MQSQCELDSTSTAIPRAQGFSFCSNPAGVPSIRLTIHAPFNPLPPSICVLLDPWGGLPAQQQHKGLVCQNPTTFDAHPTIHPSPLMCAPLDPWQGLPAWQQPCPCSSRTQPCTVLFTHPRLLRISRGEALSCSHILQHSSVVASVPVGV